MSNTDIVFNLYLPNTSLIKRESAPFNLVMRNYNTDIYLDYYTGSYLAVTTGSTLDEMGATLHNLPNTDYTFRVYMPDGVRASESYTIAIDNYMVGIFINEYSASAIWQVNPLTIRDAIIREYA